MAFYLVTGGAGFIGSNLVREILKRGGKVRVLDNLATGRLENLAEVEDEIDLIPGDIRDPSTCGAACEGVEFVLHQAALGSVPRSIDDPLTSHDVNVTGTLNLLLAARDAGVRRFVYASSSSVYGNCPDREKVETLPTAPLSPYATSKLAAENYTRVFHAVYGLETIALRYFNVFGPRQDPHSAYAAVIPLFVKHLLDGQPATIYGDGEQTRDFTYVENVVDANLRACAASAEACGRAYNIACSRMVSINQLYRLIGERLGVSIEARHVPARRGDVRRSLANIDLARKHLGYDPRYTLESGLDQALDWYQESRQLEPVNS
jgi:UDP-N-acetylglucosamine/UDP-N-acetylgalactosamine 4-epimerase